MVYSKPSELLRELDSHGIYGAEILDRCQFDTASIPIETPKGVMREIKARGLGGNLEAGPEDRLISGYKVAEALARKFLGHAPGDTFNGRGTAFRANLAALENAGQ